MKMADIPDNRDVPVVLNGVSFSDEYEAVSKTEES